MRRQWLPWKPLVTWIMAYVAVVRFPTSLLCRIVIVLLAQTAFGTKQSDEAVTYLNKGQVYEMKLFTAEGDSKENLYKSVVRLCFYERKYQFSENEQIITWQMDHIGERMLQLGGPYITNCYVT